MYLGTGKIPSSYTTWYYGCKWYKYSGVYPGTRTRVLYPGTVPGVYPDTRYPGYPRAVCWLSCAHA